MGAGAENRRKEEAADDAVANHPRDEGTVVDAVDPERRPRVGEAAAGSEGRGQE